MKKGDRKGYEKTVKKCFTKAERAAFKHSYLTGLIYLMDCFLVLQLAKNIHKTRKMAFAQKYHWLKNQLKRNKRTLVQSANLFRFFHSPKKQTLVTGTTARNNLYKAVISSTSQYGPSKLLGALPKIQRTKKVAGKKYVLGKESTLPAELSQSLSSLTKTRRARAKRSMTPAEKAALVKRLQKGKKRKQLLALLGKGEVKGCGISDIGRKWNEDPRGQMHKVLSPLYSILGSRGSGEMSGVQHIDNPDPEMIQEFFSKLPGLK